MDSNLKNAASESSTIEPTTDSSAGWHLLERLAFRFSFLYLVLYSLSYPISFFPFGPQLTSWPGPIWDRLAGFAGVFFFDLDPELLKRKVTGSGDTTFDWVQLFCIILLATAGTALWSLLDRQRRHYRSLAPWLFAGVRFFTGGVILFYGLGKVFHLQMGPPSPARLLTLYGDSSPMGLAWTFMGASAGYSLFAGLGEVIGGVLLFFRRTTTLGALILVAVMSNVVMLNLCYDIPVKIFSSHLLLFSLALLVPDWKRLWAFVVNRPIGRRELMPLFTRQRWQRVAVVMKILAVAIVLAFNIWLALQFRKQDSVKPPLYGIWEVQSFSVDDEERPPLLTDDQRWQRVIFDRAGRISIQGMDGKINRRKAGVDVEKGSMTLSGFPGQDETELAEWSFEQPTPETLIMEGELRGERYRVVSEQLDLQSFNLLNRGFHWVSEHAFNR